MKTLYLDCGMGAAGDMLAAALLELLPDPDAFVARLNALRIPSVEIRRERAVRCGITGTRFAVTVRGAEEGAHEPLHEHEHHHEHDHPHDHHHSDPRGIGQIVADLRLPPAVERDVRAVYDLIAAAESHVHGKPVEEIHFHEVGAMDAIADITAVCLLLRELAPDEVVVSPVHVGCGSVQCAHGILPVPAPATAYLLRDVPIYGGAVQGELCTPTGAALLAHFAARFGEMPVMRVCAIGYGMGKKEFERANCVRAFLGETEGKTDTVLQLSCNLDDAAAEEIAFAAERLFEAGAKEVYTLPAGMKKSRPGTVLCVLCAEEDREKMLELIFKHTTTIGVRESVMRRYVLERGVETLQTPFGEVRRKVSAGYGVRRVKVEYEDLARIARERGMSVAEVKEALREF